MSDLEAVLRWYVVLTVLSALLAPFSWWLGAGLGPARHGLLRPLGLLVLTFLVWWPAVLVGLPFSRSVLIVAVVIAGVVAWALLFTRPRELGLRLLFRSHLVPLIAFEIGWLVVFAAYLLFRSQNPDIANTEKPMEIALLSAVSRSADVPATDPWFAGEPINYYYFGYQMLGSLVKLTGVSTSVAFNLGLATAFASAAAVAASIGSRVASVAGLGRYVIAGVGTLSAILLLIAGNLETAIRLAQEPRATAAAGWWEGVGWNASRIIYDSGVHGSPEPTQTINEFPAFSFVLGDLHPHVLGYPFLLLMVALAVGFIAVPASASMLRIPATGAVAGLLYATNSWDAPLAIAVAAVALIFSVQFSIRDVWQRLLLMLGGAAIAALPFALHYEAPFTAASTDVPEWFTRMPVAGSITSTLALVTWRPSSVAELLTVHGAWLAIFIGFALWAIMSSSESIRPLLRRQEFIGIAAIVLVMGAFAWAPALVLIGIPLIIAAVLAVGDSRPGVRLTAAMFCAGLALILVPEFAYIQDAFGNRMNTVFKLFFQAWLFLSIGSAAALGIVIASLRGVWRAMFGIGAALVVLTTLPYAPLSAEDWIDRGPESATLDGASYLDRVSPGELQAIEWLNEQAGEGDVIVESPGCGYGTYRGVPMNRFSAFTGSPTVLGWSNHESQWRRGQYASVRTVLQQRQQAANQWLDGGQPVNAEYAVPRFIVVGPQETMSDPNCSSIQPRNMADTLDQLQSVGWTTAFDAGDTRILVAESDPLARRED